MTTNPPTIPRPRLFPKILIGMAILITGFALARIFPGGPSPSSDLPRLKMVPPFSLSERGGQTINNNNLYGKIWVADFIYTTCPGPCPLVTANMAKIQAAVAQDPDVQLVSFTVDPETDTPAVLAAYADHFGANKNRWWFLTGPAKPMYTLIQDGFLMAAVNNTGAPPEDGQFKVTHSTQLALVDASGVIRGYFDGVGPDGRAALLKALALLENEKP